MLTYFTREGQLLIYVNVVKITMLKSLRLHERVHVSHGYLGHVVLSNIMREERNPSLYQTVLSLILMQLSELNIFNIRVNVQSFLMRLYGFSFSLNLT